jgi:hypothetical protein
MGQSGSIIEQCKQQNVTIDEDSCAIKFGSSNNVLQFGEIEPGQLEPNTDIAGQGVSEEGILSVLCHPANVGAA